LTFANPESTNINVFATTSIDYVNNSNLVEEAIDMVQFSRADSVYIATTPDYNMYTPDSTNSQDIIYSQEAVDNLDNTGIDSNYTATYYPWILTRDTRFNTNGEIKKNTILSSTFGTANASLKFFIANEEPVIIGTDSITFTAVPTTVSFNSAAKYPTDNTVGTQDIGTLGSAYASNTLGDFKSMLNMMENDINALETSFAGTNASTSYAQAYIANAQLLTLNNLYSKMEKMVFEIARLKDDVDRMETVGFGAVYPGIGLTSRYPSGRNRISNTAGGF
jgi:hypothetical protein